MKNNTGEIKLNENSFIGENKQELGTRQKV